MAITGKTGADAIAQGLKHICRVITKYQNKLLAVAATALIAEAITSAQHDAIVAFINTSVAACGAFVALADYSSVN